MGKKHASQYANFGSLPKLRTLADEKMTLCNTLTFKLTL